MTPARARPSVAFDKRAIARAALRAAIEVRADHEIPDDEALCPYDLCEALNITVRFVEFSMEGIYFKGSPGRVLLSARRPFVRRTFNCAHELGHHLFGHGSRLDELHDRSDTSPWNDPEEFLADTFAGHLLMPTIAVRGAINRRGWEIESLLPKQVYALACDFGVGYSTFVRHLQYGLQATTSVRAATLLKVSPKAIRADLLGEETSKHVVLASPRRAASWFDVEVGTLVLAPTGSTVSSPLLVPVKTSPAGSLFSAASPGTVHMLTGERQFLVRISPERFVGLAKYRHLEDEE